MSDSPTSSLEPARKRPAPDLDDKTSKIKKMFDFTTKVDGMYDAIVNVEGKEFYVSKMLLARQSEVLKATLFEDTSTIPVVHQSGISPDSFQIFLDLLHGKNRIDDSNVATMLQIFYCWQAHFVMGFCESHLINVSKFCKKDKLWLADKFNLKTLKQTLLRDIPNMAEWGKLLPANVNDLKHDTLALLVQKAQELHRGEPPQAEDNSETLQEIVSMSRHILSLQGDVFVQKKQVGQMLTETAEIKGLVQLLINRSQTGQQSHQEPIPPSNPVLQPGLLLQGLTGQTGYQQTPQIPQLLASMLQHQAQSPQIANEMMLHFFSGLTAQKLPLIQSAAGGRVAQPVQSEIHGACSSTTIGNGQEHSGHQATAMAPSQGYKFQEHQIEWAMNAISELMRLFSLKTPAQQFPLFQALFAGRMAQLLEAHRHQVHQAQVQQLQAQQIQQCEMPFTTFIELARQAMGPTEQHQAASGASIVKPVPVRPANSHAQGHQEIPSTGPAWQPESLADPRAVPVNQQGQARQEQTTHTAVRVERPSQESSLPPPIMELIGQGENVTYEMLTNELQKIADTQSSNDEVLPPASASEPAEAEAISPALSPARPASSTSSASSGASSLSPTPEPRSPATVVTLD